MSPRVCAEIVGVCAEILRVCAEILGVCAEIRADFFGACAEMSKAARKTAQCGLIFDPIFAPHTHYEVTEISFCQ